MVNGRHSAFVVKLTHVFRPLPWSKPRAGPGHCGEQTGRVATHADLPWAGHAKVL